MLLDFDQMDIIYSPHSYLAVVGQVHGIVCPFVS